MLHNDYHKLFPESVWEHINTVIAEGEYDHADNLRAAAVGNAEQEAEYEARKATGCCGYYDDTAVIDGVEYRVGFNYGH